jgi:lysophospholipase L1-like esterase
MFTFRHSLLAKSVLACLLVTSAIAVQAAEAPVGMVDQPCPAPLAPSPKLRAELARLFFEPRTLTGDDFKGLLSDPEMAQFNAENQRRAQQDWPGLCRYSADNASVAARSNPPRVVFIGDSITENWAQADPSLFGGEFINRGIGGQTTAQMLVRFRADVVALRPKVVHILGGTNDVAGNAGPTSPKDFQNQIMSMVEIAQANGITVILGSVPPAATWRQQVKPTPIIASLNTWLRNYADSKKLGYIDYFTSLAGPSGELRTDLGNDGVHPNRSGYAVMRRLVETKLSGTTR